MMTKGPHRASVPARWLSRLARSSALTSPQLTPARRTCAHAGGSHDDLVDGVTRCRAGANFQRHDLLLWRAARDATRADQWAPLDSRKAGMDRRLAGTTFARRTAVGYGFRIVANRRMMGRAGMAGQELASAASI